MPTEPSNVRPVQFIGPDGPISVTGNEITERLLVAELQAMRTRLDQIETRLSALETRASQQERRG